MGALHGFTFKGKTIIIPVKQPDPVVNIFQTVMTSGRGVRIMDVSAVELRKFFGIHTNSIVGNDKLIVGTSGKTGNANTAIFGNFFKNTMENSIFDNGLKRNFGNGIR